MPRSFESIDEGTIFTCVHCDIGYENERRCLQHEEECEDHEVCDCEAPDLDGPHNGRAPDYSMSECDRAVEMKHQFRTNKSEV